MSWTIKVLHYGDITTPKSMFTPGIDAHVCPKGVYLGFLLQDGKQNVLVDTGIHDRYITDGHTKWNNAPAEGGVGWVIDALKKEDLEPADIDMVLYTHLHNDHTGACHLFPHAETIFQKKEWENLLDPLPIQRFRGDYDPEVIAIFRAMKNVTMVDGDVELPNGLKLYLTPGHTRGSMCILVPTDDGPRIILGALFYLPYFMFTQTDTMLDRDGNVIPITPLNEAMGPILTHGMIYDMYAYYDSYYKVRALAPKFEEKYFVFGHDTSLLYTGIR